MSELGDKTFFIAAILAMRNNKVTTFTNYIIKYQSLLADGVPGGHLCTGRDDCPLCTAGLRGDDLHPQGVHVLRLHCHHGALRSEHITIY